LLVELKQGTIVALGISNQLVAHFSLQILKLKISGKNLDFSQRFARHYERLPLPAPALCLTKLGG